MTNFMCDSTNIATTVASVNYVASENYMSTAIISIISGIIGAFVGAYSAYYLQKKLIRKQAYQTFVFKMIEIANMMVYNWASHDELFERSKLFLEYIEIIDFSKKDKEMLRQFNSIWLERDGLVLYPQPNSGSRLMELATTSGELRPKIIEILRNKL